MDVSNLLCLLVVRSFQSSIRDVFLSNWRDLSKHIVLFLIFFSFPFCFVIMWCMWETYYIVEYNGCERPAKLCHYISGVQSLFVLFVLLYSTHQLIQMPLNLKISLFQTNSYVSLVRLNKVLHIVPLNSNFDNPNTSLMRKKTLVLRLHSVC